MHPPAELFGVEPPFTAGALAATNSTVFAGHYTGHYSKINADTLELEFTSDPFFACACQGLQVFEQSLILFGNDIGSSTSEPHDWHGHLRQVRDNKLIAQLALPAGNWAMVKNIRGSIACLYDRSEKQGTLAINMQSQSVAWHIPLAPTVVNYDAEKLVALGEALTILDLRTGTIIAEYELPESNATHWTSATALARGILLAGYSTCRTKIVFSLWDKQLNALLKRRTYPLTTFLSQQDIDNAWAEEDCCGVDIFRVASIRWAANGNYFYAAIGGDGQSSGACSGYTVLLKVKAESLNIIDVSIISRNDGNSALLLNNSRVIISSFDYIHSLPL